MPCVADAQGRYALVDVDVFDGTSDAIREDAVVLVADGRIVRIDDAGSGIPPDYETIDCGGNYLMPGLFDVHTHLDTVERAQRALASGVTTVRSASVVAFEDVGLRELVRTGAIAGPDMLAAGVYVTRISAIRCWQIRGLRNWPPERPAIARCACSSTSTPAAVSTLSRRAARSVQACPTPIRGNRCIPSASSASSSSRPRNTTCRFSCTPTATKARVPPCWPAREASNTARTCRKRR